MKYITGVGDYRKNLTIVKEPAWGDEDFRHCIPIGKSISQVQRIQQFQDVADNFVIFPGGTWTMLEVSTLIYNKFYAGSPISTYLIGTPQKNIKNIFLVGKDFYSEILTLCDKMFNKKLIDKPQEALFKLVEPKEILEYFPKINIKI